MHANRLILALLIILSQACFGRDFLPLQKRWVGAVAVEVNSQYVFSVTFLDRSFKQVKDCIIYQIPTKNKPGSLKIIELDLGAKCKGSFSKKSFATYQGIYNFSFLNLENGVTLYIDEKKIYFPFQKIKSSIIYTLNEKNKNSFEYKDGMLCYDIDDKCDVIKNKKCELCTSGVYQVIASNCPSMTRKYCGTISCGKKGKPACLRGWQATKYSGSYCIADSPIAYCEKPYRVYCLNGELFCH